MDTDDHIAVQQHGQAAEHLLLGRPGSSPIRSGSKPSP
jgi:hypothetical protein